MTSNAIPSASGNTSRAERINLSFVARPEGCCQTCFKILSDLEKVRSSTVERQIGLVGQVDRTLEIDVQKPIAQQWENELKEGQEDHLVARLITPNGGLASWIPKTVDLTTAEIISGWTGVAKKQAKIAIKSGKQQLHVLEDVPFQGTVNFPSTEDPTALQVVVCGCTGIRFLEKGLSLYKKKGKAEIRLAPHLSGEVAYFPQIAPSMVPKESEKGSVPARLVAETTSTGRVSYAEAAARKKVGGLRPSTGWWSRIPLLILVWFQGLFGTTAAPELPSWTRKIVEEEERKGGDPQTILSRIQKALIHYPLRAPPDSGKAAAMIQGYNKQFGALYDVLPEDLLYTYQHAANSETFYADVTAGKTKDLRTYLPTNDDHLLFLFGKKKVIRNAVKGENVSEFLTDRKLNDATTEWLNKVYAKSKVFFDKLKAKVPAERFAAVMGRLRQKNVTDLNTYIQGENQLPKKEGLGSIPDTQFKPGSFFLLNGAKAFLKNTPALSWNQRIAVLTKAPNPIVTGEDANKLRVSSKTKDKGIKGSPAPKGPSKKNKPAGGTPKPKFPPKRGGKPAKPTGAAGRVDKADLNQMDVGQLIQLLLVSKLAK